MFSHLPVFLFKKRKLRSTLIYCNFISASIVFFSTNCLTGILFLRLAIIWPKLSHFVAETEKADPNLDKTLVRNCNISCILILCMAFCKYRSLLLKNSGRNQITYYLLTFYKCVHNILIPNKTPSFPWINVYDNIGLVCDSWALMN